MNEIGLAALCAMIPVVALAGGAKPIVLSKAEVGGAAFNLPGAKTTMHDGNRTTDFMMLMTADRKYEAGMYKSGPAHFSVTGRKTYGVDEPTRRRATPIEERLASRFQRASVRRKA